MSGLLTGSRPLRFPWRPAPRHHKLLVSSLVPGTPSCGGHRASQPALRPHACPGGGARPTPCRAPSRCPPADDVGAQVALEHEAPALDGAEQGLLEGPAVTLQPAAEHLGVLTLGHLLVQPLVGVDLQSAASAQPPWGPAAPGRARSVPGERASPLPPPGAPCCRLRTGRRQDCHRATGLLETATEGEAGTRPPSGCLTSLGLRCPTRRPHLVQQDVAARASPVGGHFRLLGSPPVPVRQGESAGRCVSYVFLLSIFLMLWRLRSR